MSRYNVLILTDHSGHTSENSLYALAVGMLRHPDIACVDIASKGILQNISFFECQDNAELYATRIGEDFKYSASDHPLDTAYRAVDSSMYDFVWLRLPPSLSESFLNHISELFDRRVVINNPKSIRTSGSKEFLMHFPSVCPPMRILRSVEEILAFKKEFPIVLKPFRAYGGKGIVKIDGEVVSKGNERIPLHDFLEEIQDQEILYLGVKYLKNVAQGDKRIIVVDGEILGASLRLPAENSWICNVSMGGSSNVTYVESEEVEIINTIDPVMSEMGIVMYGVDTLVGDEGKRVLSEINTTSIGGLPQIARMTGQPLVEKAIDLIVQYFIKHKK